eukprot:TRINITY_DN4323_c0_g1_i1.p1 TRINITY_DN4323_c0_g1~~TRINITY_DN4323_c0_g1_i1.p1  ORF type:complete len:499 (+),score=82.16 TRINITY_DN4323_c0_g1_i1:2-1498(+)
MNETKPNDKQKSLPRPLLLGDRVGTGSEFVCGICLELIDRDTAVETACGHLYDQACLSRINSPRSCPSCRSELKNTRKVHKRSAMYRLMGQVRVQCPACLTWTGSYADYDAHYNTCDKRTKPCQHCKQEMLIAQPEQHLYGCRGRVEIKRLNKELFQLRAAIISQRSILGAKDATITSLQSRLKLQGQSPEPSSSSSSSRPRRQQRFDPSMSRKERQAWKKKHSPGKRPAASEPRVAPVAAPTNAFGNFAHDIAQAMGEAFNFGGKVSAAATTSATMGLAAPATKPSDSTLHQSCDNGSKRQGTTPFTFGSSQSQATSTSRLTSFKFTRPKANSLVSRADQAAAPASFSTPSSITTSSTAQASSSAISFTFNPDATPFNPSASHPKAESNSKAAASSFAAAFKPSSRNDSRRKARVQLDQQGDRGASRAQERSRARGKQPSSLPLARGDKTTDDENSSTSASAASRATLSTLTAAAAACSKGPFSFGQAKAKADEDKS